MTTLFSFYLAFSAALSIKPCSIFSYFFLNHYTLSIFCAHSPLSLFPFSYIYSFFLSSSSTSPYLCVHLLFISVHLIIYLSTPSNFSTLFLLAHSHRRSLPFSLALFLSSLPFPILILSPFRANCLYNYLCSLFPPFHYLILIFPFLFSFRSYPFYSLLLHILVVLPLSSSFTLFPSLSFFFIFTYFVSISLHFILYISSPFPPIFHHYHLSLTSLFRLAYSFLSSILLLLPFCSLILFLPLLYALFPPSSLLFSPSSPLIPLSRISPLIYIFPIILPLYLPPPQFSLPSLSSPSLLLLFTSVIQSHTLSLFLLSVSTHTPILTLPTLTPLFL